MEKLSFDLVLDQKKSKYDIGISQKFFWSGLCGILIFISANWIFNKYTNLNIKDFRIIDYLIYASFLCILIGSFYGFFEYNGNNRVIKGFITFDENEITINNAIRYNLSEIENIKFSGYDHKGRYINIMSDGDPFRSYGGDNFVEFTYKNKEYKFQFVVNSVSHRKSLMERTIPKMKMKTNIKY
ncbi:hypothetical protein KO566_00210 [Flavobacteriaceae bacterium XHP0103]|uniref:hypothetical protein n=1 Tax=Marixanthotalea marina TaxID=2844359 RepID=UPI002989C7DB|nr:hypothetical protein [Marixanthotalea marina]MBU3820467.1 hypothetical protein [Marixanthotalea marina]